MDIDPPAVVAEVCGKPQSTVRITTSQLFQGQRYVVIVHSGQEYRLQITKAGKLILTK